MKLFGLVIAIILAPLTSRASVTEKENQALLAALMKERTRTHWTCTSASHRQAVVMFQVSDFVSGYLSSSTILAVQDPKICTELQVTCPFVAGVTQGAFGHAGPALHQYWATRGKYEDTLMFVSSGSGMALVRINNGSTPSPTWSDSWTFYSGECIRR